MHACDEEARSENEESRGELHIRMQKGLRWRLVSHRLNCCRVRALSFKKLDCCYFSMVERWCIKPAYALNWFASPRKWR